MSTNRIETAHFFLFADDSTPEERGIARDALALAWIACVDNPIQRLYTYRLTVDTLDVSPGGYRAVIRERTLYGLPLRALSSSRVISPMTPVSGAYKSSSRSRSLTTFQRPPAFSIFCFQESTRAMLFRAGHFTHVRDVAECEPPRLTVFIDLAFGVSRQPGLKQSVKAFAIFDTLAHEAVGRFK